MGLSVLHISESDAAGGAARAAFRLHDGLIRLGHRSRMLVGRKVTDDPRIRRLKRNAVWRGLDRGSGALLDGLGLQYVFYPSSFGLLGDRWYREADVLQLHNLHGSYFGFTALPALTRGRAAVWFLHDQWPLTGHVAYSLDCERWRTGCGECPYLSEYPALRRDTTARLWRLKARTYARSRLTLAVPSTWMLRLVDQSPLLRRFPVHKIPIGVDPSVFAPGDRSEARRHLGLPPDRPVVAFVATDPWERRKGLALLAEALRGLADPPLLLLVGGGAPPDRVECRSLGAVAEDGLLADVYRAADVTAVPTLADVLTQTAPESLASGTPCVSFDRGGVTDVVRDGTTGLHARYGDSGDLARAVRTLLEDGDLRARLARAGRTHVEGEFSVDRQAGRYAELYESLVAEQ